MVRSPCAPLDEVTAASVASTLQALATPSRLLILTTLRQSAYSVTELAAAIGMEQSAVSHQLRLLRTLGLVTGQREGRRIVYRLYLLVHMQVAGHVADAAAGTNLSGGDLIGMRVQLLADAAAALLVLLVAVALSVYKPKGLTRYGWRKQQEPRVQQRPAARGDQAAGLTVS